MLNLHNILSFLFPALPPSEKTNRFLITAFTNYVMREQHHTSVQYIINAEIDVTGSL